MGDMATARAEVAAQPAAGRPVTARLVTRTATLLFVGLCMVGFAHGAAVWLALAIGLGAGMAMVLARGSAYVVAWSRRGFARTPRLARREVTWWRAQAFSYLLGAAALVPVLVWPGSVAAALLLSACIAVGLLSALTPFCLGRLVYITVFERAP
jgi:hypothetical protein